MISEFQQYLINNGFKRFKSVYDKGRFYKIEDNESMHVSTYGPTEFWFEKDGKTYLYWGLGIAGKGVYYYKPKEEHIEFTISNDFEKTLSELIK